MKRRVRKIAKVFNGRWTDWRFAAFFALMIGAVIGHWLLGAAVWGFLAGIALEERSTKLRYARIEIPISRDEAERIKAEVDAGMRGKEA